MRSPRPLNRGEVCPSQAVSFHSVVIPKPRKMKEVTITTDGSCEPNPGNGGWAAILRYGSAMKEICGAEPETTNNRMEMQAVRKGLEALKEPCRITLRSDSRQLLGILNRTGKKAFKRKNQDLVRAIIQAMQPHQIKGVWVKGHNGDPDNERADFLANECARALPWVRHHSPDLRKG